MMLWSRHALMPIIDGENFRCEAWGMLNCWGTWRTEVVWGPWEVVDLPMFPPHAYRRFITLYTTIFTMGMVYTWDIHMYSLSWYVGTVNLTRAERIHENKRYDIGKASEKPIYLLVDFFFWWLMCVIVRTECDGENFDGERSWCILEYAVH